jgi:transposase InsO family protein
VIVPWKETVAVEQRMRFVMHAREGTEPFAQLCRVYGVSRRVGYKWLRRYERLGVEGLTDRSRAPRVHPNEVSAAMRERVVRLRGEHPRWGPRKLQAVLLRRDGMDGVPAASTIGAILRREGLSVPRRRARRRASPQGADPLGGCNASNRVWCADFKGWFRTGDGARCDPLTISDGFSRYLLRCQAMADTSGPPVRRVFEATFREYGLPEAIRTDNGPPFAGVGVAGLSRLSVWWVRLGIGLQRIEPGKPQQNGRHERMHLTLKQETADPPAASRRRQQACFDAFRREFNEDRPHEALAMDTPASFHEPSVRQFPERLAELEYPCGHELRRVADRGEFRWHSAKVMIGKALRGEVIGLAALDDRHWHVWFGPIRLGTFDAHRRRMLSDAECRRRGT